MSQLSLNTPLSEIKGIGPRFLAKLKRLNIVTAKDPLFHFPVRYEDWSEIAPISNLKVGDEKTIQGVIQEIALHRTWKKRTLLVGTQ